MKITYSNSDWKIFLSFGEEENMVFANDIILEEAIRKIFLELEKQNERSDET